MKRSLFTIAAAVSAAAALGQNFTIVRPLDGSHVREKVHVLFPKGSIPQGGYVGIFLNGQLLDATVPENAGKYSEFVLDTKRRGIKDTDPGKPDRLEAKLFVDYNGSPRITKTSSVDLYIGNEANIDIPNAGIKLRYKFIPGTQLIYDLEQRVAVDTISQSENEKNGKAAELPLDAESIRLLYSVDNSYSDGDGLVRLQALPEKGKTYATLTTTESATPKTYYDYMMASIYMKLTSTGNEVFGSVPLYYPIDGTSGQGDPTNLIADYPLPSLPYKAVRVGDSWESKFQEAKIDLNDVFNQESLVQHFPARGEFVGVEWEHGHPCAKIKNTIEESQLSDEDKKLAKQGAEFGGTKVQANETIWFALDTHRVLKIIRDRTVETKTQGGLGVGGGSGVPGGPGPSGGPPGPGGPAGGDITYPLNQVGRMGGRMGGGQRMGPGMRGPGGGPGMGGPGMRGPGAGDPGAGVGNQAQYIRLHIQQIFTLEQ